MMEIPLMTTKMCNELVWDRYPAEDGLYDRMQYGEVREQCYIMQRGLSRIPNVYALGGKTRRRYYLINGSLLPTYTQTECILWCLLRVGCFLKFTLWFFSVGRFWRMRDCWLVSPGQQIYVISRVGKKATNCPCDMQCRKAKMTWEQVFFQSKNTLEHLQDSWWHVLSREG